MGISTYNKIGAIFRYLLLKEKVRDLSKNKNKKIRGKRKGYYCILFSFFLTELHSFVNEHPIIRFNQSMLWFFFFLWWILSQYWVPSPTFLWKEMLIISFFHQSMFMIFYFIFDQDLRLIIYMYNLLSILLSRFTILKSWP